MLCPSLPHTPQRLSFGRADLPWPPLLDDSTATWASTCSWSIACLPFSAVITPLSCNRVLFALRRRLSISFAFRRSWISAFTRAYSCIIAFVPLAKDFNASKIGSGELLWCLLIHLSRYSVWNSASRTVVGVFEPQGVEGTISSTGGGVRVCTSSFETTLSGLKGTSPAPLKADLMFLFVIVAWNALWKAGKNSVFETWVIEHLIKCSISRPYAFLSIPKHPTSRGWSRWDEWGGIQSVIMLFSSQYISKSAEWWLPCPSRIRRR